MPKIQNTCDASLCDHNHHSFCTFKYVQYSEEKLTFHFLKIFTSKIKEEKELNPALPKLWNPKSWKVEDGVVIFTSVGCNRSCSLCGILQILFLPEWVIADAIFTWVGCKRSTLSSLLYLSSSESYTKVVTCEVPRFSTGSVGAVWNPDSEPVSESSRLS